MVTFRRTALISVLLTFTAACSSGPSVDVSPSIGTASTSPVGSGEVPRFAHVVVVILENHAYNEILDTGEAPFLRELAGSGAVLTQSYAITHPSQPNYLALFSGSTQQLTDDSCPHSYTGPNLASVLADAGRTFVGSSESLPAAGFTACRSGPYVRKHNPWVDFPALSPTVNQPMTAFPSDYADLPDVSFVVPDLDHDMHDGSISQGDRWLRTHLSAYVAWAAGHDSALIVTADEDDNAHDNRIPTIVVGAHVPPGASAVTIDHYGLLRTLLASFGLPAFGHAADARPLTTIWAP